MNTIALAFSGGGFRAACFSLGCLTYMDRLKYDNGRRSLLQHVKFISSTSGGSITNLVYSRFLYTGKDLPACYSFLMDALDGEKLIARALEILQSGKEWKSRPAKSRNLINAFSIAYDELFERATFDTYSKQVRVPVHLEEICVNATEFTNGKAFRFQSQGKEEGNGKVGNGYIFINDKEVSGKLKLSDILASSSCFPSGFEPMIFPDDYAHEGLTVAALENALSYKANMFTLPKHQEQKEEKDATPFEDTDDLEGTPAATEAYNTYDPLTDQTFKAGNKFGIMDGGVTDNQAIEAYKMANDRRRNKKEGPFDLFIACDVSSYFMDGYTLPMEKKKWYSGLTLRLVLLLWVFCSLGWIALLFLVKPWQPWTYVVATVSGLLFVPVLFRLLKKFGSLFRKKEQKDSWSSIFNKYKPVFFGLRLGTLIQMLQSRLKSVFILANDIYLKQIRSMYYDSLFGDQKYRECTIQNAIYDLSRPNFPEGATKKPLHPSEVMIQMAEKARMMGTTLWFDAQHRGQRMKECIIATGHFTTCYNLLKFINKNEGKEELSSIEKELKAVLQKDWESFCIMTTEQDLLNKCIAPDRSPGG